MVAMTSPLHRAAERPFCVCQLLHFCQLLSNPSIDREFEYTSESQWNHKSNAFMLQNMPWKLLGQWRQMTPKSTLPPEAYGPPSITWMPKPTLLTSPTTAQSLQALPHNYKTKSLPQWLHLSLDQPHSPPQTISRFNQPFCHNTLCGPTDRPTDRQMVQVNVP